MSNIHLKRSCSQVSFECQIKVLHLQIESNAALHLKRYQCFGSFKVDHVCTPAGSLTLAAEAQEVSFSTAHSLNKHSLTQNTQTVASLSQSVQCGCFPGRDWIGPRRYLQTFPWKTGFLQFDSIHHVKQMMDWSKF